MTDKQRLDVLIFERNLVSSREKARAMIMAGEVLVDGYRIDKPGTQIHKTAEITLIGKPRFVSRGGEKLAHALGTFGIDVTDYICADVGASTGGFTDCLLQNGAAKVYAIDVGYGQLDYNLRQDDRVVVFDRTNARYLEKLPDPINIVTIDASFISLKLLLPVVKNWLLSEATIISLIKPQFEAGKKDVSKGGVVRDSGIHIRVLTEVLNFAIKSSFSLKGLTKSPLKGPAGNIEFLAWLQYGKTENSISDVNMLVQSIIN